MRRTALALGVVLATIGATGLPRMAVADPKPSRVPYFTQSELGCAGACAAMLRRAHGDLSARPADYDDLVDRQRGGISARDLVHRLREQGWKVAATRADSTRTLLHWLASGPVIVLLESGPRRLHYVVVVAGDTREILIHDPAVGPSRSLSLAEFDRKWLHGRRWMLRIAGRSDRARSTRSSPVRTPVDDTTAIAPWRHRALDDLRRGDVGSAVSAARRALASRPDDRHARRILGAAFYVDGDSDAALDQWNHLGEPRIGHVFVGGTRRTNYRTLEKVIALGDTTLLTRENLRRTQRRLDAVPAIRSSRVHPDMQRDGTARVEADVAERAHVPSPRRWLLANLLDWSVNREFSADVANGMGVGDLWSVGVRTLEGRRAWQVRVAVPAVPTGPWVTTLDSGWSEETYATLRRKGRTASRLIRARASSWRTADLHVDLGLMRRVATSGVRHHGLQAGLRYVDSEGRGQFDVRSAFWDGHDAPSFVGFGTHLRVEMPVFRRSLRLRLDGGLDVVGDGAPAWAWPGAGIGKARSRSLRAHPLLDGGTITGPAFAPRLADTSIELQWWRLEWGPFRAALATFADAARVSGADRPADVWVDGGIGLRIDLPGLDRDLRLDQAFGLMDDARAFSLTLR